MSTLTKACDTFTSQDSMTEILEQKLRTAWERADHPDKFIINVSGHIFVTTYQTLNQHPNTKLGSLRLANQPEHFFDKDVAVFPEVLQFQRTGELHIPKDRCREAFLKEVKFWGLGEENLASCCRMHETFKDQSLEKQFTWFEKTIKPHGEITKRHQLIGSLIEDTNDSLVNSIPIGYWWVVVTMSTVGYGDYYPTTTIGYLTAVAVMMLGMMIMALPIAIIGSNFATISDYNKLRQQKKIQESEN
ncbi:potassium voltage-gated channel protein Shal-like [Watersipora subatra]|uniref:potassium voltage-gated channel protein Shal-like n=1 Tax=Watersipora subatra TaxID=2589382 RepID=UPI00355C572B